MPDNRTRRFSSGLIIGLSVVAFGIVLLLNEQGILPDRVYSFWPILLVAFGVANLFETGKAGHHLWGYAMVGVGLLLIGEETGLLRIRWDMIWPVIIIAVGVFMISQSVGRRTNPDGSRSFSWVQTWNTPTADSDINALAVFSGFKRRVTLKNFRGGRMLAIFGGYQLDLRQADIEGTEAVIDASSIFGGGEIRVPENWIIIMEGSGIFGGYTDDTHQDQVEMSPTAKRLIIRGVAVFGGMVVKN